jgi:hypothetical protein
MKKCQFIWLVIIVLDLILVFSSDSTFDNGDSIVHYLQSHQAWQSPNFFMDMWAKPIFVIFSSPFASIGWWGMKFFNSLCVLLSAYYTKRIFEHYQLKGWWGVFLSFFAYSFFLVQSSGLTEPLFMVLLVTIVYFELKNNSIASHTLLSFLPFVRSEGYIIVLIFLAYLLFDKRWKYLPYIFIGTVGYGIAGLFVYQDFLWMWNQNPYAGIEAKYGSGDITHFIEQLPYVIGLPIFILFFLGVFRGGMRFFQGRMELKELLLLYGVCLGYIAAHSIFWRYGLFHSFGLTRVLIVVIPFIAFIAYRGLEWLLCSFHCVPRKYIIRVVIVIIAVFPFVNNKMAMDLPNSIKLTDNQELTVQLGKWIEKSPYNDLPIYCNDHFLAVVLDKKIDTELQFSHFKILKQKEPITPSLIVWDSYFAVTDAELTVNSIEKKYSIRLIKELNSDDSKLSYKVYILE